MKELSSEAAADYINHGDTVFFGGFTHAGCPKAVPFEIAKKARRKHDSGEAFKIHVMASASTHDVVDGELTRAGAVYSKMPYQGCRDMRAEINSGNISYFDMHVSQVASQMRSGFLRNIDLAIIEAADVSETGEVVLTTGVGVVPTAVTLAKKVIIELNGFHPRSLRGIHDLYEPLLPPNTKHIPLFTAKDRIGSEVVKIDQKKIIGIVRTNLRDDFPAMAPLDIETEQIGQNVAEFLANEIKVGRIPREFLPVQSGVGNISNAVLIAMSKIKEIPKFSMFSEILQDSCIEALKYGDVEFASAAGICLSDSFLAEVYSNFDFFKKRIILRTQEISNSPEVITRLGIISMNTALEADIFGNVNSSHVNGSSAMNGLGGAADFSRNAYLSIFTCKSVAKCGKISAIVPFCSHIDHTEHDVKVLVTEQGVADLRGKDPMQRASSIIENCVHPMYRDHMRSYLKSCKVGHIPCDLSHCFDMYKAFEDTGDMRNARF